MEKKYHSRVNSIPEGFTLPMALMDCLPVIFFSVGVSSIALRFDSAWFRAGAFCVILAGSLKVLWKFVLALGKKDIPFLNRQMRFLMPAGFLIFLLSLFIDRGSWSIRAVLAAVTGIPSLVFWILGFIGIACMIWFARHLDGRDAKSNWKEQGVNSLAQFCFMMAVLAA